MLVPVAIELLARPRRVHTIHKRDECEALSSARFSVLCEEDACDATEVLEDRAEVVFFGHFGDLWGIISGVKDRMVGRGNLR